MTIAVGVNVYGLLPKAVKKDAKMRMAIWSAAIREAIIVRGLLNHRRNFSKPQMYSVTNASRLQQIMGIM